MKKALLILVLLFSLGTLAKAQELQCEVRVNSTQVAGSDKTVYQSLQTALYEFINNTKFTEINFRQNEKIEGSILIDVKSRESDYFTAEINIALRRPVYKTNYNSPLFNYVDRKFTFEYMDGQSLDFNPNNYISQLTSTIGYYIYLMLGLDFDSFSPLGGTPFFAICEQITRSVPQGNDDGWSSTGRQNRYALITEINNPTYEPLRQFIYEYHRQGLDMMSEKTDEGRVAIFDALSYLRDIYERNSMSYFLQLIVETKRDEIIQVFSEGNMKYRTEASNIMKTIDPSQSSRYDEMLQNSGK
jgi:hypothetical protein